MGTENSVKNRWNSAIRRKFHQSKVKAGEYADPASVDAAPQLHYGFGGFDEKALQAALPGSLPPMTRLKIPEPEPKQEHINQPAIAHHPPSTPAIKVEGGTVVAV